jgi:3-methyladenine DNA glycosylase AlkD
MNCDEVLSRLKALGLEKVRAHNAKFGAGENQFGVKMGDLRALAKELGTNHDLGLELWQTGNLEAMLLATLIIRPKLISAEDLEEMVRIATYSQVADWLGTNVIKVHPQKEELRQRWMASNEDMTLRAGWSLTTERVIKSPDGLNLEGLLDRIDSEMGGLPETVQWTMNYCLAQIGILFPAHRDRALAIGEKLGVFRDFPTSKGCTSPFAPTWINAMVARQV